MGFRTGSFATVWAVEPRSDTFTKIRISTSRKNKDTGEYEQDFSGFVACFGSAVAAKAAKLKERDRIKLGDVDVTNTYDKGKGETYTNFNMYSFEIAESQGGKSSDPDEDVEDGEDDGGGDPNLPF